MSFLWDIVLSGSVRIGDTVELPALQIQRKVKSMQMFKKNVRYAQQGDRVGICVTNLDPKLIERAIAASPGAVPLLSTVLCLVKKVCVTRPSYDAPATPNRASTSSRCDTSNMLVRATNDFTYLLVILQS